MNLRPIIAVLALFAAAACTSPSSDVPAAGVWGEATVIEELSIGVEFGADEYMFGFIVDVEVAPDGTIFVADAQLKTVRAYSSRGIFLRQIGRTGQGPGEYTFTPIIDVLPSGDLGVWDAGNRRVSTFSPDGDYVGGFRADSGFGGRQWGLQHDASGSLYVFTRDESQRQIRSARDLRFALLKYSAGGDLLDTLLLPTEGVEETEFAIREQLRPFTVVTKWALDPNGRLLVGRGDRYWIGHRDRSGVAQRVLRDIQRVRLHPEERSEWEAFRELAIQRNRPRHPDFYPPPIPDTKPFFRDFFVGDDGRIWVHVYVAAEKRDVLPDPDDLDRPVLSWREPNTYDVFEPDGTFFGSVVVPELFRPFVFRGDRIWGTLADAEGVERLVRLRVVPEVR